MENALVFASLISTLSIPLIASGTFFIVNRTLSRKPLLFRYAVSTLIVPICVGFLASLARLPFYPIEHCEWFSDTVWQCGRFWALFEEFLFGVMLASVPAALAIFINSVILAVLVFRRKSENISVAGPEEGGVSQSLCLIRK